MSQKISPERAQQLRQQAADSVQRYEDGWRAGRPVEDPDKMKRWGFITANPSEFLIVLKGGKVDTRRSGQGVHFWKWPWESIAIVPTSLQQVAFVADQVTQEKVGVTVSGLAVYRIVNPMLAFRVLNFSYAERASEKLAATLRDMFVGASRRLIANLTLEECMQKRKEAIASFLMDEISPVVSGRGSSDDDTDQGWGVVLDTIEIQDVQVQSERVFADLQAPFRTALASRAEQAELQRKREVAERKAESERAIAEASIAQARETRSLKAKAEAEAAEVESREQLRADLAKSKVQEDELTRRDLLSRKQTSVEQEIRLRQAEAEAVVARRKLELEQTARLAAIQSAQKEALSKLDADEARRAAAARAELAGLQSEAQLKEEQHRREQASLTQTREREAFALETKLALQEKSMHIELTFRRQELAIKVEEQQLEANRLRLQAELEQVVAGGRALQTLVGKGLPELGKALQGAIGPVSITHVGGGQENPLVGLGTLWQQGLALWKGLAAAGSMPTGREDASGDVSAHPSPDASSSTQGPQ